MKERQRYKQKENYDLEKTDIAGRFKKKILSWLISERQENTLH